MILNLEPNYGDWPYLPAVHDLVPETLMPFSEIRIGKKIPPETGIHFFVDDYRFEKAWSRPEVYARRMLDAQVVLSPDFSVRDGWPLAIQMFNVYRSRWIGRYLLDFGIPVIPTVTWSDERSFDFCFQGLAPGGTCAIGATLGADRAMVKQFDLFVGASAWIRGVREMERRLCPSQVLCYGMPPVDFEIPGNWTLYPTFTEQMRARIAEKVDHGSSGKSSVGLSEKAEATESNAMPTYVDERQISLL